MRNAKGHRRFGVATVRNKAGDFFFFLLKWPLKCFVALGLFFGVLGIEIRLISL